MLPLTDSQVGNLTPRFSKTDSLVGDLTPSGARVLQRFIGPCPPQNRRVTFYTQTVSPLPSGWGVASQIENLALSQSHSIFNQFHFTKTDKTPRVLHSQREGVCHTTTASWSRENDGLRLISGTWNTTLPECRPRLSCPRHTPGYRFDQTKTGQDFPRSNNVLSIVYYTISATMTIVVVATS